MPMSNKTTILALAAMLAGCEVPTAEDPTEAFNDTRSAAQVRTTTVVDGDPQYFEPINGVCPEQSRKWKVAAHKERMGEPVGGWFWVMKCRYTI